MGSRDRILVVYYSLSGNTEQVAKDVAARLGAELLPIRERRTRRGWMGLVRAAIDSVLERPAILADSLKHPADYALTVIGGPIWAGKMATPVRAYLKAERDRFNRVALFVTSGSDAGRQVIEAMEKVIGQRALASAGFDERIRRSAGLYEAKIAAFAAALTGALEIQGEPYVAVPARAPAAVPTSAPTM